MRRACQRAIQTVCVHTAPPFHAGRALFSALQQTRAFTPSATRREGKEDSKVTVRWFEQTGEGRDSIRPMADESAEDLDQMELNAQELFDADKEFKELGLFDEEALQKEIAKLEEEDEDEFDEDLPPSDRKQLQSLDQDEIVDLHSLDVHYQMPQLVKRHIERFNKSLKQSAQNPQNLQNRRELWGTYLRCSSMPGFLDQITDQAWKVLWRSQSAEPFFNEQAGHLLKLAEHMQRAGYKLTPTQKLTHIKALEANGRTEDAMTQWYSFQTELEADGNVRHESAALGVTLACALERPAEAQEIAFSMIRAHLRNLGAARLLIPVISAWARVGSEEAIKQAWLLYLLVRRTLGKAQSEKDAIDAADFDQIYLGFVEAGRKDLAVLVFKDLIVAGQQSQFDSMRVYSSYNNVLDNLHAKMDAPEQINNMSLEVLSQLPKRFENKFFYASWMKRLIGMGRVDVAVLVMELMYERGISPDAKHVNGIIGAWLRQGSLDEQKIALELAWTMADERLKLVAQRNGAESHDAQSQPDLINGVYVPVHLRRRVPAATTETLCLLLLYYSHKKLPADMERVERLLIQAELRPNSYFMNHLMYYYCNQGKWAGAWNLYLKMTRQVPADLATFACLWDCAHGLTRRFEQFDNFPAPRRLFSTMMNWFSQLPPKGRTSAQEDFGRELYSRIVQVFMQFKDTKGMLVAMYAMKDSFGLYPDDETIRAVTIQVAQMSERRQAGHPLGRSRTRRRKAGGAELQKNIERSGKVLQMVLENRAEELAQQGHKLETLDEEERGRESLFVLAEFLRAADRSSIQPDLEDDQSVALSEELDQVAWDMGAGPFKMGPPLYDI